MLVLKDFLKANRTGNEKSGPDGSYDVPEGHFKGTQGDPLQH